VDEKKEKMAAFKASHRGDSPATGTAQWCLEQLGLKEQLNNPHLTRWQAYHAIDDTIKYNIKVCGQCMPSLRCCLSSVNNTA